MQAVISHAVVYPDGVNHNNCFERNNARY